MKIEWNIQLIGRIAAAVNVVSMITMFAAFDCRNYAGTAVSSVLVLLSALLEFWYINWRIDGKNKKRNKGQR